MGALSLWRPFRELQRLERDLEARFPDFFGRRPFEREEAMEMSPVIESFVQNGQYVIRADLPGLDPKDVEIRVLGNTLMIKGERKSKTELKEQDYFRREVSYGAFERRLTLPEGADADKIKAHFKNGVVEITMPAPKGMEAKKIPLQIETK